MRSLFLVCSVLGLAAPVLAVPIKIDDNPPLLIVSMRTGTPNIFLVKADGSAAKNLTNDKSYNSYPAWSPDKKKIAFASNRDGNMNIYVMDADGSNVKRLTQTDGISRVPTWSPDGKKIAFCRYTAATGTRIHVIDADGNNAKQLGAGDGYDPAWSPDGKKILFVSPRSGLGYRVYVMDADGSNTKEITTGRNQLGFVYPTWSPDGKKILYADQVEKALELFLADADGKNPQQLTKLGGANCYPSFSSDGKRIAFHHAPEGYTSATGTIYQMDSTGKNLKVILHEERPVEGGRPAWRP